MTKNQQNKLYSLQPWLITHIFTYTYIKREDNEKITLELYKERVSALIKVETRESTLFPSLKTSESDARVGRQKFLGCGSGLYDRVWIWIRFFLQVGPGLFMIVGFDLDPVPVFFLEGWIRVRLNSIQIRNHALKYPYRKKKVMNEFVRSKIGRIGIFFSRDGSGSSFFLTTGELCMNIILSVLLY